MAGIVCEMCGANDWIYQNGLRICNYCRTTYVIPKEEKTKNSDISLNDDIARLLEKCKKDPSNAKKYANLILDIDPTNQEAMKYV